MADQQGPGPVPAPSQPMQDPAEKVPSPPAGEAEAVELDFEQAFTELEAVVRRLESGEAGLEESLRLFEQGVRLARLCTRKLDEAEGKIELLLEDDAGLLRLEPFDQARRGAAS